MVFPVYNHSDQYWLCQNIFRKLCFWFCCGHYHRMWFWIGCWCSPVVIWAAAPVGMYLFLWPLQRWGSWNFWCFQYLAWCRPYIRSLCFDCCTLAHFCSSLRAITLNGCFCSILTMHCISEHLCSIGVIIFPFCLNRCQLDTWLTFQVCMIDGYLTMWGSYYYIIVIYDYFAVG